jgi:16S rRNA (uracil1498-N3)-methyltransferase
VITHLAGPAGFDDPILRIEGEPYRHLFRARRVAVGERLRVVDGRGRARWGEVARVNRSWGEVMLGEEAPSLEPAVRVDLLVATLRPERASWLVEKATEVGVHAVRFLHTERAPRTFGAGAVERLHRVAAAAVEQCGRARVPEVTGTHEWTEFEGLLRDLADRRFLDTATAESRLPPATSAAALLVGPEGGWSPAERTDLLARGFHGVGLGPRILRTETASLIGVAALLGS